MSDINIGRMVLGVCGTNCYLIYKEDSKEVIFVDPADKGAQIYEKLAAKGFQVKAILLTHGHFDHILGCKELKELSGAPVYALQEENVLCEDAANNLSAQFGKPCTIVPDCYLKDGEVLTLAGMSLEVIATPGHTIGSCCFYFEEGKLLVSGDTLFQESVGRTDFVTGSQSQLVRSIKEKLFVLPNDTQVFPGHGDSTTIEHEKTYNPFVN